MESEGQHNSAYSALYHFSTCFVDILHCRYMTDIQQTGFYVSYAMLVPNIWTLRCSSQDTNTKQKNKRKNCDYEDNNILDVTIKGQEMGAESVHPYTDSFLLHMQYVRYNKDNQFVVQVINNLNMIPDFKKSKQLRNVLWQTIVHKNKKQPDFICCNILY